MTVPDFRAFEVNPMPVQGAMELYIIAHKYCLTGLRDCAELRMLKGWEKLPSPEIEEDVIRLMVHFGFGPGTTNVFDKIKSVICRYVHYFMVGQDRFKTVVEELVTRYPGLRELLLFVGPKMLMACREGVMARDDRSRAQEQNIEDLKLQLAVARRTRYALSLK